MSQFIVESDMNGKEGFSSFVLDFPSLNPRLDANSVYTQSMDIKRNNDSMNETAMQINS